MTLPELGLLVALLALAVIVLGAAWLADSPEQAADEDARGRVTTRGGTR